MKTQLYESKNVEFSFDNETNILYETWKVDFLEDEEYKKELLMKCNIVKKYKPNGILDDISFTEYALTPDLQDFTKDNLVPVLMDAEVKKHAFIIGKDIFVKVSMQQLSEDAGQLGSNIKVKYFDNQEDAKDWLIN